VACAIILGWKAVPVDVRGATNVSRNSAGAAAGGGAIYGLGIFGALVFFWQQADGFLEYLLAILQGLLWPAFMVYEVFAALA
jgi:predicted outer membrane repeat protein